MRPRVVAGAGVGALAHCASRSASAFDSRSRSAIAAMRAASGGTIASSRSSGSAGQPRSASAGTSAWIASMPHFSLSGRTARQHAGLPHPQQRARRVGRGKQLLQLRSRPARPTAGRARPSAARRPSAPPHPAGRSRTRRRSGRSAGCADNPRGCALPASPMKRSVRLSRSASPPTRSTTVPVGLGIERVDGEVAPLGVRLPVAAERAPWRGGRRSRRRRAASSPRRACRRRSRVIVPCSMPVGTVLKPAALARRAVSSGSGGGGDVDVGRPAAPAARCAPRRRRSAPRSPSAFSAVEQLLQVGIARASRRLAGDRRAAAHA